MATRDDRARGQDDTPPAGTPRWVKVVAIIAVVAIVVAVIVIVTGPGGHGPGRHTRPGDAGTPPAGVQAGHAPPTGAHARP